MAMFYSSIPCDALSRLSARRILSVLACILLPAFGPAFGGGQIHLGPSDGMALDQPRVAVEVYEPDPFHSLGPDLFNEFLLDTGAQGIIAVNAGYGVGALEEMEANGYQTEGTYAETGIGGQSIYDVSAVYNVAFAGSNGSALNLFDARLLSNPDANFGGWGGVMGMPAMVGRVTTLDNTALPTDWMMGVGFSDTAPAADPHRYSVDMEMVYYPPEGADPAPTYAPLPFLNVQAQHDGVRAGGNFVLDTGAMMSMLSTSMAFSLGLDANGDGDLWDDAVDYQTLTGASGSVVVPVMAVDRLLLPTAEGVDLLWTDLIMPVYDIDPSIDGIFGCELLTSGWTESVLVDPDIEGQFRHVHFDFRNAEAMEGTMLLDLSADLDEVIYPGDADLDGDVDPTDLSALGLSWAPGATDRTWAEGDFDGDGDVDPVDLAELGLNWNPGGFVPEPSSMVCIGFGAALFARRKRGGSPRGNGPR